MSAQNGGSMEDLRIGRIIRALRQRLGWRQSDLARRTGMSQQYVSEIEGGRLKGVTVGTLRSVATAVGLSLPFAPSWRGAALERLLDLDHARLGELMKRELEREVWLVQVEVTYGRYGERGSIDLLAYHPATGIVLMIEIKTIVPDLQGMLRSIDAKARLAEAEARRFGWRPRLVVPCLVLADGSTNRRRVGTFSSMLAQFSVRGYPARAWLRTPAPLPSGNGLLLLRKLPSTPHSGGRRAGRQRVRKSAASPSVTRLPEPPLEVPIRA